uniref:Putative secreted peptide n=1 Tax=Anopheles braziliensis TaxID=58242 RepID=A0A2M3ZVI1_9DIPT
MLYDPVRAFGAAATALITLVDRCTGLECQPALTTAVGEPTAGHLAAAGIGSPVAWTARATIGRIVRYCDPFGRNVRLQVGKVTRRFVQILIVYHYHLAGRLL